MKQPVMRGTVEFDVFISYASADAEIVMPFVERLKNEGISVWIDREKMVSGLPVMDQLGDAIANSAHTVAFLTDAYLSRDYTAFELQSSMNRDPASTLPRTIPIKLRPLTHELPNFIQHLTFCELGGPDGFERAYDQIKRSIRQAPRAKTGVDEQAAVLACEACFQHGDEPEVTLFLIRRAAAALAQFLYRQEVGEPEPNTSLETLLQALMVAPDFPVEIAESLSYIRTFGNFVIHDDTDRAVVTRESIEPALTKLRKLAAYAFPDRPVDDRTRQVVAQLPRVGDSRERQIPGTRLRFQETPTGRTSLGPLFPGRDMASGEERSVNLVDLPRDGEVAFLDLAGRYAELDAPELLVPTDAGVVDAGNGIRCLYLAFPLIRDISARELAALHGHRLPVGPVYEIGLGVASALAQVPPSLPRCELSANDVRLSRFGVVHLLGLGRPANSRSGDPHGFVALLRGLLTGTEAHGERALTGDLAHVEETLRQLADSRDVSRLTRILSRARKALPSDGPTLRSLMPVVAPSLARPTPSDLELIESYRVRSRRAWPLGEGRVLAWEEGTEQLAVVDGPRPRWRDDKAVPIRLAVTGRNGQVAVGGWNGAVRYFVDGEPVAVTRLDGPVGDLAFAGDGLVAGSWRHTLTRLTAGREPRPLLEVANGVHRITVARGGDRFAVADLSGRLAIYQSDVRVSDWREVGTVADLAYAGPRLVLLTEGGLKGLRPDDTIDGPRERPGALRLLSGVDNDVCILLVDPGPHGSAAPLEAWSIDREDRHIRLATFPAGSRVLSTCAVRGRFTVALPGGGCAYWRDGAERQVWPDARSAELALAGGQVVVALTDRVELYATDE